MRARSRKKAVSPARTGRARHQLCDNIGGELVFNAADLVPQDELTLLEALYLNKVGTGRGNQGSNRRVEVTVFLQQARQLLPQRAFFFVSHCHRWLPLRSEEHTSELQSLRHLV